MALLSLLQVELWTEESYHAKDGTFLGATLQMDDPIKGKASLLCGPHLCIPSANPRDIQSQNIQISHLS